MLKLLRDIVAMKGRESIPINKKVLALNGLGSDSEEATQDKKNV